MAFSWRACFCCEAALKNKEHSKAADTHRATIAVTVQNLAVAALDLRACSRAKTAHVAQAILLGTKVAVKGGWCWGSEKEPQHTYKQNSSMTQKATMQGGKVHGLT